jgi:hypothetical protein
MVQHPAFVAIALCLLFVNTAFAQPKKTDAKADPAIVLDPWGRPSKEKGQHVLYIWQDDDGWHLRAHADGKKVARFSGTIRVVGGTISKLWGTEGLEPGDEDVGEISKDKRTITFRFKVINGEDGFDFSVSRAATRLDVEALFWDYDHPEMIRIGKGSQIAPTSKISLPTKRAKDRPEPAARDEKPAAGKPKIEPPEATKP